MKKEDYTTFVPKELVINPESNGAIILTYVVLNMYGQNMFNDPIYITPAFVLGHTKEYLTTKRISEAFSFISDIYPDFLSETDMRNVYKLDVFKRDISSFVKVPYSELEMILNSEYSYKLHLIKMYYLIIGSFMPKICNFKGTNYGFGWFMDNMATSAQTISTYTTCLNRLQLIYIYQDKARKTNVMCRYCDMQEIRKWAKENGYTGGNRTSANQARSLKMKYRQMLKGKTYSPAEVKEIRAYIQWYNEHCEAEKREDMEIFDTLHN